MFYTHSNSFEITIPRTSNGSASTTFRLTPAADNVDEADEILTFTATGAGARGSANLTLTSATPPATVTISDDADNAGPTIVGSPVITSDPGSGKTYKTGDDISATVTFNEFITVTGTPKLAIKVGAVDKVADCVAGSAGAKLVCTYTVVANDADLDGIEIQANQLTLPANASIKDEADNDANLNHRALGAQQSHKVDTSPPAKPTGVVATVGDTVITLSWNDPSDLTIVKYQWRLKEDTYWSDMISSNAKTTTYTLRGMENGKPYTLQIRAVDAVHESAASDDVQVGPTAPPAKPAGFTAEAAAAAVVLSWTNHDDSDITKWQYTQNGGTKWIDMAGSGKGTVVYRVSDLTNGTEYTFRIRAVNGAGNGAASDSASATPAPAPALQITELVTGLAIPWGFAFTPDGTMLFTQRGGGIKSFSGGRTKDVTAELSDLYARGEIGLMGIVVDPNFNTNRRFYTCQSHQAGPSGSETYEIQVIAWTINAAYTAATRVDDPLVGGIPTLGGHGGCRLRFGPDGYLWISTGDGRMSSTPQDLTSLGGKILRVNSATGTGAPDNPFASKTNANAKLVYTYGHRNPQGLALRPGTKQMWSVEHGPSKDDEINLLVSGGNYGWSPLPNRSSTSSYGSFHERVPMTDLTTYPDAVVAKWSSGSSTLATSGGIFLEGEHWGIWEGRLAVATLKMQQLFLFHFTPDGALAGEQFSVPELRDTYGRLRTPMMDSDGALYITTSNGYNSNLDKILRVTPARAPEFPDSIPAIAVAENTTGTTVGDPVAAMDLNRDVLEYSLSGVGSDNFTIDASTGQISVTDSANLDYETTIIYTITVSVTDGKDAAGKNETTATIDDSIEVTINVTDVAEAPLAPILTSATAASTTALEVTWTAPDNAGRPNLTDYTLQYKSSGQKFDASRQVAAAVTATATTISNLRANTTYQVRVRAINSDGNGAWSQTARGATAADTARPEIQAGPAITSKPENGDTYAGAETIRVALTFNEPVTATGKPRLRIQVGSKQRWAKYADSNESGTKIFFTYQVKDNDVDADGISIKKNRLDLNGGAIVDANGNDARLKHPKLAAQAAHRVDGVKPTLTDIVITSTPENGHTYVMGERMTFSVKFSEEVVVRDRGYGPFVAINICIGDRPGGPRCEATWSSDNLNTSGSEIRFEWFAFDRDYDTDGIGFPRRPFDLSFSGIIEDTAGNVAVLTYSGSRNYPGHKVDGYTPQAPWYPAATAGDGQVTLSWTIPNDFRGYPDESVIKYQYRQRAGDDAYGEWTDVPGDGSTTQHTVGSLENGTTYTFQVRALDTVNTSDETEEVAATPTSN